MKAVTIKHKSTWSTLEKMKHRQQSLNAENIIMDKKGLWGIRYFKTELDCGRKHFNQIPTLRIADNYRKKAYCKFRQLLISSINSCLALMCAAANFR